MDNLPTTTAVKVIDESITSILQRTGKACTEGRAV